MPPKKTNARDTNTKRTTDTKSRRNAKEKPEPTPNNKATTEEAKSPERKTYGPNEVPAAYTVHRPPPPAKEHRNEDLSTVTKLGIVEQNRGLIYKETQLTKAKVEKMRAQGILENDLYLKLKKSKEERRWDILMKSVAEEPKIIHAIWEFIRVEYRDVHSVLQDEYVSAIRRHFQPRLENLKSTPGNLLKMSDILLEITEEYDIKIIELNKSVSGKDRQLDAINKNLLKIRAALFQWGEQEIPENNEEQENQPIEQQIMEAMSYVEADTKAKLLEQKESNEELEKKIAKLNKSIKDKDKKIGTLQSDLDVATERVNEQEARDMEDGNGLAADEGMQDEPE